MRREIPPSTYRYGDGDRETLDVFAPERAEGCAIVMFVHGGAWKDFDGDGSSAYAATYVHAGHIYAAVDFASVPDNTIPGMVDQCRRALLWLWRHAEEIGGARDRLFVAGHSSGGHLTMVLLGTDWVAHGAVPGLVEGGLVMSGMCDLVAPQLSSRGRYMKLTPSEVHELSAINYIDRVTCPVIVAYGSKESPEFIRQSRTYAEALRQAGRLEQEIEVPDTTHAQVPNVLLDPTAPLTRAALAQLASV